MPLTAEKSAEILNLRLDVLGGNANDNRTLLEWAYEVQVDRLGSSPNKEKLARLSEAVTVLQEFLETRYQNQTKQASSSQAASSNQTEMNAATNRLFAIIGLGDKPKPTNTPAEMAEANQILGKFPALVNYMDQQNGYNFLMLAVLKKNVPMRNLLLDHGANPKAKNEYGHDAYFCANRTGIEKNRNSIQNQGYKTILGHKSTGLGGETYKNVSPAQQKFIAFQGFLKAPEFTKAGQGFFGIKITPEHIGKMLDAKNFNEVKAIAETALSKDSPKRADHIQKLYESIRESKSIDEVEGIYRDKLQSQSSSMKP